MEFRLKRFLKGPDSPAAGAGCTETGKSQTVELCRFSPQLTSHVAENKKKREREEDKFDEFAKESNLSERERESCSVTFKYRNFEYHGVDLWKLHRELFKKTN